MQSLPPLFSAFAQPLQRLPMGRARQEFLKELRLALEDGIIQPICAKLEEDLRLLVHATMQGTRQALPLSPPEDALAFLRLRPLRLTESDVVDIKDQAGAFTALTRCVNAVNTAHESQGSAVSTPNEDQ